VALGYELRRIGRRRQKSVVRNGLDPDVLPWISQVGTGVRGRTEVHGPATSASSPHDVDADVGHDLVNPGSNRAPAGIESVPESPSTCQGLLNSVLGVGVRAEHSIAIAQEGATKSLQCFTGDHVLGPGDLLALNGHRTALTSEGEQD
jgi:hypothetical protein